MKRIPIFILTFFIAAWCNIQYAYAQEHIKVALSEGSKRYINWIHHTDPTVEVIDLARYDADSAIIILRTCNGVIMTGGEDVVPAYYGKAEEAIRCEDMNGLRDKREFAIIKETQRIKMPIFGVCRGQQIMNVALGGTLTIDLPTDRPSDVSHRNSKEYDKCLHAVYPVKNSWFKNIVKVDSGDVISIHHQAIDKLAPGLRVVAWSKDKVAEAVEWENPKAHSFLMAVQFHPERAKDLNAPMSKPLMEAFLKAAKEYDSKIAN